MGHKNIGEKQLKKHLAWHTALANKGKGFYHYGKYLFDEGHTKLFILHAHLLLKLALQNEQDDIEGYRDYIVGFFDWLEKHIPENLRQNPPDLNSYSLGEDPKLRDYRLWCLNTK